MRSLTAAPPVEMDGQGIRPRPMARLWRTLKIAGLSLALTAGSIGGYWGFLQYEGNLHVVRDGILYRSAQLDKAEIRSVVAEYGIKSVLNLRGANAGSPWY